MSNAARAQQEPTMEEILASIRRIISDDTQPADAAAKPKEKTAEAPPVVAAPKAAAPAPAAEPAAAEEEEGLGQDDIDAVFAAMDASPEPEEVDETDDVLELTSDMSDWDEALAEADAKSEEMPADEPAPSMIEPAAVVFDSTPEVSTPPVSPKVAAPAPAPQAYQDSRPTQAQVFAEALLSPATDAVVSSAFGSLSRTLLNQNPRTVEDLVSDMLRPMLKDWLDANLPQLVERMVRAEIERMSRGHH